MFGDSREGMAGPMVSAMDMPNEFDVDEPYEASSELTFLKHPGRTWNNRSSHRLVVSAFLKVEILIAERRNEIGMRHD